MIYLGSSLDDKGKITLDRDTFKVLASETRVGILKNLDEKQMTVSDLARAMEMNKATLFEHLEKMINAGLIKKKEDERKWVYYYITWKGKNILHPERTKIVIALSIVLICSILLIFLIVTAMNQGFPIFGSEKEDRESPIIEYMDPSDINIQTERPIEFEIEVTDNNRINKTSLKIEYTLSDSYVYDMALLNEWSDLSFSLDKNIATVEFPPINWANNSGRYLYIRSSVWDINGNFAENIFVDYIDIIYDNSLDLSISQADVTFGEEIDFIPPTGEQKIPVKIIVHNTGNIDVSDVDLKIYRENPDTNSDGIVDNQSPAIINSDIGDIESKNTTFVEYLFYLNLSQQKSFFIAIDPYNSVNEINETNNIVEIEIVSQHKEEIIPEFTIFSLLIITVFIIFLGSLRRFQVKKVKK